jgi:cation transport ATPase
MHSDPKDRQTVRSSSGTHTTARAAIAVAAGYVVIALLSTLVQEIWLGGVSYQHSSRRVLVLAGIFTPLTAVAGGLATTWLSPRAPLRSCLALCGLIVAETTYLYVTGRVDGPLWFEAAAAASLVVAVLLGCMLALERGRAPQGRRQ